MTNSVNPSTIRILNSVDIDDSLSAVGAGILVSERTILTCSHVVNTALDLPKDSQKKPSEPIYFDFPLLNDSLRFKGEVESWYPVNNDAVMGDMEDIALLKLSPEYKLPSQCSIAKFFETDNFVNRELLIYGFPIGVNKGTNTLASALGYVSDGKVQLEHRPNYRKVEPGFSGAAAWDIEQKAVLGMVVYIDRLNGIPSSYIIPYTTIKKVLPMIKESSLKKLTLNDLESMGILIELAKLFNDNNKARNLLAKINFPRENIPQFETSIRFWRVVCQDIEDGIALIDFHMLLNNIATLYPYNPVFSKYK